MSPTDRRQVQALLWLRSREALTDHCPSEGRVRGWRAPLSVALQHWQACLTSVWVLTATMAAAGGVIFSSYYRPAQVIATATVTSMSIVAWLLWAVVPSFGGGANEVARASRLAPYPVSARALFTATWIISLADIPYLLLAPIMLGSGTAVGWLTDGFLGATLDGGAILVFIASSSATGQLCAWTATIVMSDRGRAGRAATAIAMLLLLTVVALRPAQRLFAATLRLTPAGWLNRIFLSSHTLWPLWLALLLIPLAPAWLLGPRLTAAAAARESTGGVSADQPWGQVSSKVTLQSALRAMLWRSILRSRAARVALLGVIVLPVTADMAALGSRGLQVSVNAIAAVGAVTMARTAGANVFGYLAGGMTWLGVAPLRRRELIGTVLLTIGGLLLVAQLLVAGIGVVLGGHLEVSATLISIPARTLLLSTLCLRWSVAHPASADFDSLRTRVAPPRTVLTFLVLASACVQSVDYTAGLSVQVGTPAAALLCWTFSGSAAALLVVSTLNALRASSLESLALAVRD